MSIVTLLRANPISGPFLEAVCIMGRGVARAVGGIVSVVAIVAYILGRRSKR